MVIFERRMTIEYEADEWDEVEDLDRQVQYLLLVKDYISVPAIAGMLRLRMISMAIRLLKTAIAFILCILRIVSPLHWPMRVKQHWQLRD